ncbi:TPA: hypothetical protein ROX88_001168 [Bacillus pseudomycoides]|nr:hypothetical protein [Bacillus pseudomycoides]
MKRTLAQVHSEYESIIHSNLGENEKTLKLSNLMTEMERTYKIPLLQNVQWEKENPAVIAMYRKISMSREL